MADVCAICQRDTLEQPVTLDCEHTFCGMCIVNWLRTGTQTCPVCRDPGERALETVIHARDANERVRVLLHLSRRKTASRKLVKAVERYRKAKERAAEAKRATREYRVANSDTFKEFRRLRAQRFRSFRRERAAKLNIGFSIFEDDPQVPIVTADHSFRHMRRLSS